MNLKKKQIIKAYGKEMIAEMYLDLLNFTENAKTIKNSFHSDIYNKEFNMSNNISYSTNIGNRKYTLSNVTLFDDTNWNKTTTNQSRNNGLSNTTNIFVSNGNEKYSKNTFTNTMNSFNSRSKSSTHDSKVSKSW